MLRGNGKHKTRCGKRVKCELCCVDCEGLLLPVVRGHPAVSFRSVPVPMS